MCVGGGGIQGLAHRPKLLHHVRPTHLLANLGDEEGSHTGSSSTTHGVGDLESLHDVAGLCLLTNNVHDGVNELGSLGVVALGPVVSGSGLSEDEVVRAEDGTISSRAD